MPRIVHERRERVDDEATAAVGFEKGPDLQEMLLGGSRPRVRRIHPETARLDVAVETNSD
jgi:hypothetical protein